MKVKKLERHSAAAALSERFRQEDSTSMFFFAALADPPAVGVGTVPTREHEKENEIQSSED
jgi:hypothetical protein